jgi:hypothetical protein
VLMNEHDFGDNSIITIVKTGLTTKYYVIVLSVLNLVSDFVKCNRSIGYSYAGLPDFRELSRPDSC